MLDTSRRYFKIDTIKKVLDAMNLVKFNVFHWHIVDDDSFPMQTKMSPEISQHGAFAPDQVYTAANMADVVAYA